MTNNPLRYADPTGHMEAESNSNRGDNCSWSKLSKYCVDGKPLPKDVLQLRNQKPENHPSACDGIIRSVVCKDQFELPADYTSHNLPITFSQDSTQWEEYANGLKMELKLFDLVMALQNGADSIKPVYRQFKGVLPFTAIEAGASSGIQTIQDFSKDLSFAQRVARSGIVGLQAAVTDVVSDGYGIAGFTTAGPAGYVTAAFSANLAMDKTFDSFNASLFPRWRLGAYP